MSDFLPDWLDRWRRRVPFDPPTCRDCGATYDRWLLDGEEVFGEPTFKHPRNGCRMASTR